MLRRSPFSPGHDLRCCVCRSKSVRAEPFYYSWRSRRWWIVRCAACTHRFVYPFLTRAEQEVVYDDNYFTANGDWVEGVWPLGYVQAEPNVRKEAAEILDMLPRRRGRLLEIGCAGGFFLDEARKRGFDVAGIELNATMAAHARTTLGLNVIQGRIEDIDSGSLRQSFDIIVLMDVLEHIPDPRALFHKISDWLAPEADLLIRGPLHNDPIAEAKEWIRRLMGIQKELPGYPLDVNGFTKKSLTRLLGQFGFGAFVWINEGRDFANLTARRLRTVAPSIEPA
jgi:2-polyprenyl-3-methyl-5-hydroxy-6-metoxy-1,4-benzoquinol methylase